MIPATWGRFAHSNSGPEIVRNDRSLSRNPPLANSATRVVAEQPLMLLTVLLSYRLSLKCSVVNAVLDDIHPRLKSLSDGFTSGCTKSHDSMIEVRV